MQKASFTLPMPTCCANGAKMSQKLPVVTGDRLVRALRRAGFVVIRIRGSAHVLRHAVTDRMVSVHVHKGRPLKRGTLLAMLEDAGLTVEQLRALL
jgi:predicted RNA binding protein YcfA (HicA-like mRNA interferase family)